MPADQKVANGAGRPRPVAIEDHALIGDCETAALVARDGTLDWLCWPRFDSGACFASLLGDGGNGHWRIAACDPDARISRRYRPCTLILETEIVTRAGRARVIDFMPPRTDLSHVVRIVEGLEGQVEMETCIAVRFHYGGTVPWVTRLASGHGIKAVAGSDLVLLRASVPLSAEDLTHGARFTVAKGQRHRFVLTNGSSLAPDPPPLDADAAELRTERFWHDWTAEASTEGPHQELLLRSLITLKALTYAPTGGIVAAPTTSLPEAIGGVRNWDYRYCWLRDATLTLLALMNARHFGEARAWRDWLVRAAAGSPSQIRIMYGIGGERFLPEWELPWLSGYEGSRPVRVGNAASNQLQLDVFGEVMDALYQARAGGIEFDADGWSLQRALLEHLETIWREPDDGIWETRGGRRHFTHSKVMAWVAFDRGVRTIERFGLDGPLDRWREVRATIHDDVCTHGFDASLGAFTQAYGERQLDASALLIPNVGFLPPDDARVRGTIAAIERHLMRDGLVMRYETAESRDGLPPGEGAFLACSFWLADAYLMLDRLDDARRLFDRLAALANDLGLFAEEYCLRERRQLGNFPQAFSHVALINTIQNLSRVGKPAAQRADRSDAASASPPRPTCPHPAKGG
jgi:GH15 family glucan-1,4-alpha-glucosidase